MSLPDSKTLKKLADACRKAGIKHFKNAELEFTLTDEAPVSQYKKSQKSNLKAETKTDAIDPDFTSEDSLTEEQLLLWSVQDSFEESTEQ